MVIDYNPYLQCSDPYVHRSVMTAIVKVESGGNPWAININKKGVRLLAQAANEEQAKAWIRWFVANGYNIDIGLAQINIKNIQKSGKDPVTFLEPCTNLTMAGQILKANYQQATRTSSNSDDAVKKAISAYNTGNFRYGFSNGYVGKVIAKYNGQKINNSSNYSMTPPLNIASSSTNNVGNYKAKVIKKQSGQPVNNNYQLASANTNNNKVAKSQFYNPNGISVDLWSR